MIVSIFLTAILALFTFNRWKNMVLPSMLAGIVESPYRYCYAATLWRYAGVVAVYGFIFFTLIWGSAYLLGNISWSLIPANGVSRQAWTAVAMPLLVLGLFALGWLPGLRNFTLGVHRTVMRHLFFPIIPSSKEDYAINQLMQVTEEMEGDADAAVELSYPSDRDVQRQLRSIVVMHGKLLELLHGRHNQLKRVLYGEEWSLIHNLYQAIVTQLHHHPDRLKPDLLNTIQLCQYYCCHLLVRCWFSATLSDDQRRDRFDRLATHG